MAVLRKCIGSARFGIEAHEAPADDFPVQPSRKDGLGRLCQAHWNQYTAGLAREAKARKAVVGEDAAAVAPAGPAASGGKGGGRRAKEAPAGNPAE